MDSTIFLKEHLELFKMFHVDQYIILEYSYILRGAAKSTVIDMASKVVDSSPQSQKE